MSQFRGAEFSTVFLRGSQVSNQGAGTVSGNWTVTVPSSCKRGDYLILVMSTNADTVTAGSGWSTLQHQLASANPFDTWIYGKVADATDDGGNTYTWNTSNTTAAPVVATMFVFANVDSTKVVSAVSAESASQNVTTPSVSITVPSLMMHARCSRQGSATAVTFTYGAGTKTEGTNAGSVAYTASGSVETAMTYTTGSQTGTSANGSAAPTASFSYQIGLGAKVVPSPNYPTKNSVPVMRGSL